MDRMWISVKMGNGSVGCVFFDVVVIWQVANMFIL